LRSTARAGGGDNLKLPAGGDLARRDVREVAGERAAELLRLAPRPVLVPARSSAKIAVPLLRAPTSSPWAFAAGGGGFNFLSASTESLERFLAVVRKARVVATDSASFRDAARSAA